jgi:dienelactone hydrolase
VDGRLESQQHTQRRRIRQVQDVMRVIDYLETRDDIGQEKIGYISISSGSQKAPIMLAVEKRFRTGVMIAGGLAPYEVLASCDPFNFAPNVSVPVLMLNGETDAFYPLEEAQIPLFRLLGSLNEHKRHSIYPGGHGFYASGRRQKHQVEREILDWLDKYLGVPETSDSRKP